MDEGLRVLEKVRDALGVPILTDVHDIPQIAPVAEVVDAPAKLAPRPADGLMLHHQRLAVAVFLDGAVEEGADGLADQLLVRDAVVIRDLRDRLSIGHGGELSAAWQICEP